MQAKSKMAIDDIVVAVKSITRGETRINDVDTDDVVKETLLSTSLRAAFDPPEFPSTPDRRSSVCDVIFPDAPTHVTVSPAAARFSTPTSNGNICCTNATCSVCLSPILCRTTLVETRCKVQDYS